MENWLAGGKYDDLSTQISGEEVEKTGKKGKILTVPRGKI